MCSGCAFSLPTQRCFRPVWAIRIRQLLFSAYAEVFLSPKAPKPWKATFLCLRRGVSARITARSSRISFSLPTQRCFPPEKGKGAALDLFSAYAEVFPVVSDALAALAAFLCLRRGVSIPARPFLVPGVTFLCLRRDVSTRRYNQAFILRLSLPTQRCFRDSDRNYIELLLFSAYAEVFPRHQAAFSPADPFLCLRRDVSIDTIRAERRLGFSLPTQRCFLKTDFR